MAVCFIAIVCALSSCEKKSALHNAIDDLNKNCPISMGVAGKMTEVTYDEANGNMIMKCEVNEDIVNIGALNNNPELFKLNAMNMVTNASGNLKKMFDMLKEANAGVTLSYKGATSGTTASITISIDDIKEAQKQTESPIELIKSMAKLADAQTPATIADGMVMTGVKYVDGFIVYEITVNAELISVEAIRQNFEANTTESKKAIITAIKSDPGSSQLIAACKKTDTGIAYKYISNKSGESYTVKILSTEL